MLPHELRDSSLVGVYNSEPGRRTLVHPLGPYLTLEHQKLEPPDRWSAGGWHTTSVADFVDAQPAYVNALQEALVKRNEAKNTSEQPNLP
jgi:hypothetical protein